MSPVVRRQVNNSTATRASSFRQPGGAASRTKGGKASAKAPRIGKGGRVPGSRRIVNDLLPSFSRQLAAMLSAGMAIVTSLDALQEQSDNVTFKFVIGQVKKGIEGGSAFSEALKKFPSVFDDLYINMIHGGESSGQLPETIARLAGFLEDAAKLKRKVKSAMMYPLIVLCLSLGIATAMIIFIVPVFGQMYDDFDAELPGPTQFLLNVSVFIRGYGVYIFVAVVLFAIAFRKWRGTEKGGYQWDSFVLKAPVFGELTRKVASSRFARTFGQMIRSGVPVLQALTITSGATGNKVTGAIVAKAKASVEKGEPLSSAMLTQTVFPVMLVRMLQAGEKTGKVDEMMDNIADFYDDEVETMLAGLTSLLEPLLIVFLGVIVGGIVLCMFMPIFKMGEIVSS